MVEARHTAQKLPVQGNSSDNQAKIADPFALAQWIEKIVCSSKGNPKIQLSAHLVTDPDRL